MTDDDDDDESQPPPLALSLIDWQVGGDGETLKEWRMDRFKWDLFAKRCKGRVGPVLARIVAAGIEAEIGGAR